MPRHEQRGDRVPKIPERGSYQLSVPPVGKKECVGGGVGCACVCVSDVQCYGKYGEACFTDLERKSHVRGVCPTILFPVEPGRRLARMARVERDKVVGRRQPGILELRGEPGRVEELGVEEEDGRLGGVKAAHGAGRGVGDVPKRGVVVVRVREIDVWHGYSVRWGP